MARFVRNRIFDGTYAAGEYVRLDQLAAELGISVTPVREALFQLRAEGLLDQKLHRGFVVLPVTRRDITDVSDVQAHIGGELAARAAMNITDDQVSELESIQTQLETAYAGDDHERAVRLNHDFHRAINVAADSPKLAQLMSQITRYAPESVFPVVVGWPKRSMTDSSEGGRGAGQTRRRSRSRRHVRASLCRRGSPDQPPQATRGGHLTLATRRQISVSTRCFAVVAVLFLLTGCLGRADAAPLVAELRPNVLCRTPTRLLGLYGGFGTGHGDVLWESTGNAGQSQLRQLDPTNGTVRRAVSLPHDYLRRGHHRRQRPDLGSDVPRQCRHRVGQSHDDSAARGGHHGCGMGSVLGWQPADPQRRQRPFALPHRTDDFGRLDRTSSAILLATADAVGGGSQRVRMRGRPSA